MKSSHEQRVSVLCRAHCYTDAYLTQEAWIGLRRRLVEGSHPGPTPVWTLGKNINITYRLIKIPVCFNPYLEDNCSFIGLVNIPKVHT